MEVNALLIPDILIITPERHLDERGFFSEVYRADALRSMGIDASFVQDNHSASLKRGVLRGLHFQVRPRAQGKLVRCSHGAILDIVVDIRRGSPTFGKHVSTVISATNWRQIWVPPGFAHGYVTLEPDTEILYKATDYFDADCERGIAWNDPDLAIDWGADPTELTLSPKDRLHPCLVDAPILFDVAEQGS